MTRTHLSVVAALLLTACGGAATERAAVSTPAPPPRTCSEEAGPVPLATWSAEQRAALDVARAAGLVVVARDGCEIRVLAGCHVAGSYRESGGELAASRTLVSATNLEGACEGATHYVTSMAPARSVTLAALSLGTPVAPIPHDRTACPADNPGSCAEACARGTASACTTLGWMLEKGEHAPADPARAALVYRTACLAGQQVACNNLALMVARGAGVDADPKEGAALLKMACLGGDTRACANLGIAYRDGLGVPKDAALAVELFHGACEKDDGEGCALLGHALASARDAKNAVLAFTRGCSLGDPDACNDLAVSLLDATGPARDDARASELLAHACEGDVGAACHNLGSALAIGRGVARDPAKAAAVLEKGCSLGAKDACEALGSVDTKLSAGATALLEGRCAKDKADPACVGLASLRARTDPAGAFTLLRGACEAGTASACEGLSAVAARAGKVADASLARLEPLCGAGNDGACTAVADLLGPKSRARSEELYTKACADGRLGACARGADALLASGRAKDAAKLLATACVGSGAACAKLATLHASGKLGKTDEVAKWHEAACLAGHGPSCEHLARTLERTSPALAERFARRACDAGVKAQCRPSSPSTNALVADADVSPRSDAWRTAPAARPEKPGGDDSRKKAKPPGFDGVPALAGAMPGGDAAPGSSKPGEARAGGARGAGRAAAGRRPRDGAALAFDANGAALLGDKGSVALVPASIASFVPEKGPSLVSDPELDDLRAAADKNLASGNVRLACGLFARVFAAEPGAKELDALGRCLERAGASASAWMAFTTASSPDAARLATALPRITFAIAPDAGGRRPEVFLDEKPLPEAYWGKPLPIDPGRHAIRVHASAPRDVRAAIAPTGGESLTFRFPEAAPVACQRSKRVFYAGAFTAVTALAGAGMGVYTLGEKSDFDSHNGQRGETYDQLKEYRDSALRAGLVTNILLGAAVVGAGVTTWWYLNDACPEEPAR